MAFERTIVVSTRSIVTFFGLAIAVLLLYVLRDVLVTVFVALVLSAAIDPSVSALQRRGLPRPVGLAAIIGLILAVIVTLILTFVPMVVDQAQQLVGHVPEIYGRVLESLRRSGYPQVATSLENGVRAGAAGAGVLARSFFGRALNFVTGLLSVFGVFVLTIYMAMQQQVMKATVIELSPPRYRARIGRLARTVKTRLGQLLRGQLLLGAVIGGCSYVGLLLLHVKFSLVLALLAGVTEMIPVIGPIVGAIPAILIAASDQPIMGLWVGLMYVAIQQLENHLLVPRIMASVTGLNPITVLVGLLVAAKLAGIVGVFLAVPATIIVQTLIDDWR